jgi:hypothetical protein
MRRTREFADAVTATGKRTHDGWWPGPARRLLKEKGMSVYSFATSLILTCSTLAASPAQIGEARRPTAPETFNATANVKGVAGAAATFIDIKIDRYTPDADREAMATALKTGGYPALLAAIKKAPAVGTVSAAKEDFVIRWARMERSGPNKRTISVVTERPVYFVGAGKADAKDRKGYELAVLQFVMDDSGVGTGTMAAAARIKPGGPNGFQIDDYADQPIELVTIHRKI